MTTTAHPSITVATAVAATRREWSLPREVAVEVDGAGTGLVITVHAADVPAWMIALNLAPTLVVESAGPGLPAAGVAGAYERIHVRQRVEVVAS